MADRIVMGYWDCPFCDRKKIEGTKRVCPECGNPRGSETKFYMDRDNVVALSEAEAKDKGKGADWLCPYCDKLNPVDVEFCIGCGAPKEESKKDYYSMNNDTANNGRTDSQSVNLISTNNGSNKNATTHAVNKSTGSSSNRNKHKRFGIIAAVLMVLLVMVGIFRPRTKTFNCTDVSWNSTINIEAYETVNESDWSLPSGGRLQYTREEVQSYVSVIDHYETVTKTRTVQSGSHTEYDYVDNGDGTFKEVSRTVPDYTQETYTEEEPVYRQDPIFATKYYYEIEKWIQKRKVEKSGNDHTITWGDVNLAENEREGTRSTECYVYGWFKKGKNKKIKVDESMWNRIEKGRSYRVKTNSTGAILEVIE